MIHERCFFVSVWLRGEVFAIGSYDGEGRGTVERIDMLSKRRTLLQQRLPLPGLRELSAAALDDRLYIIGGRYRNGEGRKVNSDAMYCLEDHPTDPSAATWTLQPGKLNTPRSYHASISFEGRMWVAGGIDDDAYDLSRVEVYDAVSKKWEVAQSMTKRRYDFDLLVVRGELYAVGGDVPFRGDDMTSIEKLDKVSGEWRVVAELGESRLGCGAACMGSKIYMFGGRHGGNYSTNWNFFDVETEQWASASTSVEHRQLPREFSRGSAVVVPSSTFMYT
jgi:hypothetical protein